MKKFMLSVGIAMTVGAMGQQLPYASQDLVFISKEQLKYAEKEFLNTVDISLNRFIRASDQRDYQAAYQEWSDLFFRYLSLDIMLNHSKNLSEREIVKEAVPKTQKRITTLFREKLKDKRLKKTFLENAQNAEVLTPQQRLFTSFILKEYPQTPETLIAQQALDSLPQASFTQMRGDAEPISGKDLSEWKVFTANIICFPGELTYIHGGIIPWKARIEPLCKTILEMEADVVCLQEVWDPEAMRALIDQLKGTYAYFVYNAGDSAGTLDPSKAGYNSGLFFASKIPMDEVTFYKFPRTIPQNFNRGALMATFSIANKKMALANTHLQYGSTSDEEKKMVRFEQLAACKDLLQDAKVDGAVLLGDLNIDGFIPELQESRLPEWFQVGEIPPRSLENATANNYFNDLVLTPSDKRADVVPYYELLDYVVSLKGKEPSDRVSQTKVPLFFSLEHSEQALSDHHGLLTTWFFSE